jgi:TolB-like protein/cytochrome c-type biogenesis protein CcmH/NrfG
MSADADQEYFADGISEELLNTLARFEDLRVVGRTSSFSFRDSDADLKTIGEALGVDVLLEGSVRKAGNRVRITAQLVDARDGIHRWSETYDRELGDIFAIQTEIATAIATALRVSLSSEERVRVATPPTQNLAAYQAYLLGNQRIANLTGVGLAEAVDYFQQAIELDPNFALAYVGLADAYIWQSNSGGFPRQEVLAKAQVAVDKALALDEGLGEAYNSLAGILQERRDFDAADATYQRALELNPNYATTYYWYGELLRNILDRPDEALALHRKAFELDPLSAAVIADVGLDLSELGRFDEALASYENALEVDPEDITANLFIGLHYFYVLGQLDGALVRFAKTLSIDPDDSETTYFLGLVFLSLGDTDRAEYWIQRSIELGPDDRDTNNAMQILHLHRENRSSLDSARKAIANFPGLWPALALLRNHELREGRPAEARALYERFRPELLSADNPKIGNGNYNSAIDLALVLIRTGEQERADLLLNRSLEYIQTIPRLSFGYRIADAQIYALQGDKQKALSALRQAIDEGWRARWWYYLKHDPNLESLHDEPEFQAMVAEIEADMAEQLARVREMERNGELEPIPEISTTAK